MSGDTLDFLQGNRETITGTLHDPAATTGHVLTVQADKSIAAAPGGGAAVEALYAGNNVSVANQANTALTWDTLLAGTELLDRTVPDSPSLLSTGVYALTANIAGESLSPSGWAVALAQADLVSGYTQDPASGWGWSITFVANAGDQISASVLNKDGVSSRNFSIGTALLVKLS